MAEKNQQWWSKYNVSANRDEARVIEETNSGMGKTGRLVSKEIIICGKVQQEFL